ncbi:MAG: Na+/H+ antiporter NhaA [Muribaculaceae bacterium]
MAVFYTARKTLQNYMNGGTVLLAATVLALICCNIPFTRGIYEALWSHEVILQIGDFNLFSHHGEPMSVMAFINDALMAVFFFTVGLEIKREILVGELSNVRNAMLPIIAAVGGMLVPVTIYWLMAHNTEYANGMAIPMATDIAFSLGVLSLLGKRVPIGLMVFLTTLAVADDIGGILVIALFYSTDISVNLLLVSAGLLVLLFLGGKAGIQSKLFYGFMGIGVWFCFLNAGIHPTIAGVLIAFCVPAKPLYAPAKYIKSIRRNIMHFAMEDDEKLNKKSILNKDQMNWLKEIESSSDKVISPLQDMEDSLHPLVNYLIVPLFAFANAGIFFGDMEISQLFHGLAPSIIVSLVLGKFLGIFLFSLLTIKLKWAPMPNGATWGSLASVSVLGGIGFTVSLFIAGLSFGSANPVMSELLNDTKLGILAGSLLAGVLGFVLLHFTLPKGNVAEDDE